MTEARPGASLPVMDDAELSACVPADPDAGLGALSTHVGNLPLRSIELRARLVALTSRVVLTQRFVNPHAEPIEATYIFPLPDRGAVTALRMTAGDRTVVAHLQERGEARRQYEEAVASGRRAAIAEEERPDVFTLRVGNILPGEEVAVELTVVGVLPVVDGAATFRFPLVVAPRYMPGAPLSGDAVGPGWQPDTDAVPDASRISPPVLLPGFPYPVRLDIEVEIEPAGLPMGEPRSSLHAVHVDDGKVIVAPGERPDRDVVLRIPLGHDGQSAATLSLVPDGAAPGGPGTFEFTVLPPDLDAAPRPRDVVLLLDRSGSMAGWKIVAARRAAARIVDTLTSHDRFAVLAFDDAVDVPADLAPGLVPGTDRNRFRAVEFLARLGARGGTELAEPLGRALATLLDADADGRQRVIVVVTDGQVGNEDQILRSYARAIGGVRLHAVGIDQAVNAGFLGRLASLGGGRCELVESEDRLDEAMATIHRRIGSPLVSDVDLAFDGLTVESGSMTPARSTDLFAGVSYVVRGRYVSASDAGVTLRGVALDGRRFTARAEGRTVDEPAITAAWARAHVRDLEDRFAAAFEGYLGLDRPAGLDALERDIVECSLRFGVLSRFTAFVAVDKRVVADGSTPRSIVQPVPLPSGWELPRPAAAASPAPGFAGGRSVAFLAAGSAPRPNVAMPARAIGRARAVARSAFATPAETAGDDAELLRELLAGEARRLRALADESEHRRREALLDLSTRLTVLGEGMTDGRWRRLLELLRPEHTSVEPLDRLWPAVLDLLDELAGPPSSGSASPPDTGLDAGSPASPGLATRRDSWRRRARR